MRSDRMPGPAYWASGGEVRGRTGPLSRDRAAEVAGFFDRQADARRGIGDFAAARLFTGIALDLRRAMAAAEDWRRAASGRAVASCVRRIPRKYS